MVSSVFVTVSLSALCTRYLTTTCPSSSSSCFLRTTSLLRASSSLPGATASPTLHGFTAAPQRELDTLIIQKLHKQLFSKRDICCLQFLVKIVQLQRLQPHRKYFRFVLFCLLTPGLRKGIRCHV